jgi:hypothetical protein
MTPTPKETAALASQCERDVAELACTAVCTHVKLEAVKEELEAVKAKLATAHRRLGESEAKNRRLVKLCTGTQHEHMEAARMRIEVSRMRDFNRELLARASELEIRPAYKLYCHTIAWTFDSRMFYATDDRSILNSEQFREYAARAMGDHVRGEILRCRFINTAF